MGVPKCSECNFANLNESNGGLNGWYCINSLAMAGKGVRLISKCDRGSKLLKTKTSPKWCPKRV